MNNVYKGGVFRAIQHIVGGFKTATACTKCPNDIRQKIKVFMEKKTIGKSRDSDHISNNYEYDGQDYVEPSNSMSVSSQNKRQKQGPMDMFVKKPNGSELKEIDNDE